MKRKVVLSTYCIILTILVIGLLIAIMMVQLNLGHDIIAYFAGGTLIVLCGVSLFFTPQSVIVEDGCVNVNTFLRAKSIPLRDIAGVALCPPSLTERRILGSGGWFGYWGWFREPSIGKYFAYYGKASDCFLVRLKNGKLYMLGCVDPESMVEYIRQAIGK